MIYGPGTIPSASLKRALIRMPTNHRPLPGVGVDPSPAASPSLSSDVSGRSRGRTRRGWRQPAPRLGSCGIAERRTSGASQISMGCRARSASSASKNRRQCAWNRARPARRPGKGVGLRRGPVLSLCSMMSTRRWPSPERLADTSLRACRRRCGRQRIERALLFLDRVLGGAHNRLVLGRRRLYCAASARPSSPARGPRSATRPGGSCLSRGSS